MGSQSHPPRLSNTHGTQCRENTAINFVCGSYEEEHPFRIYTKESGVDIVYPSDGFIKICTRYKKYLLHLDRDGHPIDCPSSDLTDVLLHFPTKQVLSKEAGHDDNEYEDDISYDNHGSQDNNSTNDIVSLGSTAIHTTRTEGTSSSSLSSSQGDTATPSVDSMSSFFEKGTRFRVKSTQTIWEIQSVKPIHVEAVVVRRGIDTTIEDGITTRLFHRTDKEMLQGLVSYNT